jgi:Raf kinase inhibitor-like YbhB/YbcL family protein
MPNFESDLNITDMKFITCLLLAAFIAGTAFAQTFTLKSNSLGGQFTNEFTANAFGCSGGNNSPELNWSNAPAATKSFAVTMYDFDAPTGSGFWHWIMVNIPGTVHELKQNAGDAKAGLAPGGSLQSVNDAGFAGYLGPCPPVNDAAHRYMITIYALDTDKLGTTTSSSGALTGFLLGQHTLAKASLVVYCKR